MSRNYLRHERTAVKVGKVAFVYIFGGRKYESTRYCKKALVVGVENVGEGTV